MARIAAIFQVWLVASGTTMGASTLKATSVISGRLRLSEQTLGAVYCMVVTLESVGAATTSGTVFQFVAFGIKNAGLWGA